MDRAQSSSLAPKTQTQNAGRRPPKVFGQRRKSFWKTKAGERAKHFLKGKCANPSRDLWHFLVCLIYKSESGCKYGETCRFRHTEVDGQPSKKSKQSGGKELVAILQESVHFGLLLSQDYHPRKSSLRKEGTLGSIHTVKFHQGPVAPRKSSGKKGSIARSYAKV